MPTGRLNVTTKSSRVSLVFLELSVPRKSPDPPEPIVLLEVNENTIPSGVLPIQFPAVPSLGFNFPSVIIEVTPEEFDRIQSRELQLPGGLILGDSIPRQAEPV